MSNPRDRESLILSELFGEADEAACKELESALKDDPRLADELKEMKKTMHVVSQAELVRDPGEEFWKKVWPQFQNRLLEEEKKAGNALNVFGVGRSNFWRPALQLGIVAVMLIMGIFIGQYLSGIGMKRSQGTSVAQERVTFPYEDEVGRKKQEYLLEAAETSLAHSGDVLNNFMQIKPEDNGRGADVIESNRDQFYNLLDEITQLRNNMPDSRYKGINSLFDEVEIMVGEIAGIGGDPRDMTYEIRSLQRGIAERKLLDRLKKIDIRVYLDMPDVDAQTVSVEDR